MSLFESESHSFVLRLWQEHGTPADASHSTHPAETRGWVEHVQTGERYYFRDLSEIKSIITTILDEAGYSAQAFEPIQAPPEDDHS
jgi:hypothetical protein